MEPGWTEHPAMSRESTADTVHHVPCEIQHTGAAKISEYFAWTEKEGSIWSLEASFRGRPWKGCNITRFLESSGMQVQVMNLEDKDTGPKLLANAPGEVILWAWDPEEPSSISSLLDAHQPWGNCMTLLKIATELNDAVLSSIKG